MRRRKNLSHHAVELLYNLAKHMVGSAWPTYRISRSYWIPTYNLYGGNVGKYMALWHHGCIRMRTGHSKNIWYIALTRKGVQELRASMHMIDDDMNRLTWLANPANHHPMFYQ